MRPRPDLLEPDCLLFVPGRGHRVATGTGYFGRIASTDFYVEHFARTASVYGFDLLFPLTR